MGHPVYRLHKSTWVLLNGERNQKLLMGAFGMVLALCSLIMMCSSAATSSENNINTINSAVLSPSATAAPTSTKWWIKMTATPSPFVSTVPINSEGPKDSNCVRELSPALQVETYAYIALIPPLPNRIRTKASLSSSYVGQFEPGAGLKVMDGPVCTDGYSWWLVESLDKRLRGWTVEGRNSEQWIMPCPNIEVQCSFLATPTPTRDSAPHDNPVDPTENACKSEKLAIGMLAHVHQDSLLVIRAEPSVGAVVGHAGPMSIVNVMEGPSCVGGTMWWKVNALDLGLIGWTTENYLEPCPKDGQCNNLDPS